MVGLEAGFGDGRMQRLELRRPPTATVLDLRSACTATTPATSPRGALIRRTQRRQLMAGTEDYLVYVFLSLAVGTLHAGECLRSRFPVAVVRLSTAWAAADLAFYEVTEPPIPPAATASASRSSRTVRGRRAASRTAVAWPRSSTASP